MSRFALGFASPNILASLCAMVLPATAVAWPALRRHPYWCSLAVGIGSASVACLVASSSRGGIVAAVAALALAILLAPGKAKLLPMAALCCLLVAIACCPVADRVAATSIAQPSIATRLYLWRVGAVLAADHPLAGIGGGSGTFGLACVASARPPEHLSADIVNPFAWAINDPLDIAAKHGVPLAILALAAALAPFALGCSARMHGHLGLGTALAAGACGWVLSGQSSCVWFFDPLASALAWSGLAGASLLAARAIGWPAARRALLAGLLAAAAWGGMLLAVAPMLSAHQPRLVAAAGPVRWSLQPRGDALGAVAFLVEDGESEEDVLREVLQPIAANGYAAAAVSASALSSGSRAAILVAHGLSAPQAMAAAAAGQCATLVLLDPPAECADRSCGTARVIAVHGDKAMQRDRDAWRMRLAGDAVVAPCARIWDNRMHVVWPSIDILLRRVTERTGI